MVIVPMPTVRTCAKAFGRLVGRTRGDPAVTLTADSDTLTLRCQSGGIAVPRLMGGDSRRRRALRSPHSGWSMRGAGP